MTLLILIEIADHRNTHDSLRSYKGKRFSFVSDNYKHHPSTNRNQQKPRYQSFSKDNGKKSRESSNDSDKYSYKS